MDKWENSPRVIVEKYSIDSGLDWGVHAINDILFRAVMAHVDPTVFELAVARTALYELVDKDD